MQLNAWEFELCQCNSFSNFHDFTKLNVTLVGFLAVINQLLIKVQGPLMESMVLKLDVQDKDKDRSVRDISCCQLMKGH